MSKVRPFVLGLGALIAIASAVPASAQYYYSYPSYGSAAHQQRLEIMRERRARNWADHQTRLDIMAARREYNSWAHNRRLDIMAARRGYGYSPGYSYDYGYSPGYSYGYRYYPGYSYDYGY